MRNYKSSWEDSAIKLVNCAAGLELVSHKIFTTFSAVAVGRETQGCVAINDPLYPLDVPWRTPMMLSRTRYAAPERASSYVCDIIYMFLEMLLWSVRAMQKFSALVIRQAY